MSDRGIFLISLLIFAAIFLAAVGVLLVGVDRRKQRIKKRLEDITQEQAQELQEGGSILRDTSLSNVPALDAIFQQFPPTRHIGALLHQADMTMKVEAFLFLSLVLALLGGFINENTLGVGDVVAVVAGVLPDDVVERPMLLSYIHRMRDDWGWSQTPQGC